MRHPSPTVIARGPRGWVWCVRTTLGHRGGATTYAALAQ